MESLHETEEDGFLQRIKDYCMANSFHHSFDYNPSNEEVLKTLRPYIPRFLTYPNWFDYLFASEIDEGCWEDNMAKVYDHVYLVCFSGRKKDARLVAKVMVALIEESIKKAEFKSIPAYAIIFLQALVKKIDDTPNDDDVIIIGVYIGMGGSGAVNGTSRSSDHFTSSEPKSLLTFVLLAIDITNRMLAAREAGYEIKARRTILASVQDLDLIEYGRDIVGALETVISMLLGSALGSPGGLNVASCGLVRDPPSIQAAISRLPASITIADVMRLNVDTSTPRLIPYSISIMIGALAFRWKRFTKMKMVTMGDLLAYNLRTPGAFDATGRAVVTEVWNDVELNEERRPRRKEVGERPIQAYNFLAVIPIKLFDRTSFGQSLSVRLDIILPCDLI